MEQYRDPVLSRKISDIKENEIKNTDYLIRDEVLCQKVKQNDGRTKILKIVPQSYQWSINNHYHEALKHFGWEKTLDKLKEHFWFDKMSSKVRSFIDNRVICKTLKGTSGATQMELHPIEKIAEPFHTIHIDISGKLSGASSEKEYVFVAVDAFSKFVLLKYASKKNQESALQHLKEIIFLFGAPKRIIVDGDGAFVSQYEQYCKKHGIELHHPAAYTSRANGQAERVMRVIKDGLTVISNTQKDHWEYALGALQLAINCSVQSNGENTY
ncbi:uncharacterized protein K02A2.6-like [Pararge aegeria]|uniref:uncharacterized protein K02A2.6-like n=1 Tax=Pararge aegeria TaxID=116150 RepID=UPI0019D222DD|nr:uncharacterized protein K02A2.6-like [Pararge aegeria]